MKWLLVSTNPAPNLPGTAHPNGAGWNIGDVFARLGTEQIIREVDPSAEFDVLNMDSHESITTERAFDRCVLAGRPLFWKGCETHPLWTHVLGGWPGRDPRKVLALGVGDCYALPVDRAVLAGQVAAAAARCWRVVLRMACDTDAAKLSVCPSAWLLSDRKETPTVKLCNFMPHGGHYPNFSEGERRISNTTCSLFADTCRLAGFLFVAHSEAERDLADALSWPPEDVIFSDKIETYVDAYASASHYFGNRMHGAVVLAGRMAVVMAVGYDSRLGMVDRAAGGVALLPSQVSVRQVAGFCDSAPGKFDAWRMKVIAGERARMVRLMAEFAQ